MAHEFAEKHGYEVDANQELNAHAAANLVSGLFGGMIAAGSMSASAVKEGAGARSQVTNLVTWVVTIVTLLFLTPLFAPLPESVLAALIIHAVWHIIASRKLQQIRLVTRDRGLAWRPGAGRRVADRRAGRDGHRRRRLARVCDLPLQPAARLVVGAGAWRARRLRGSIPPSRGTPVPGVLIVRADGALYFANALTIRDRVKAMLEEMQPPPKAVIIDASAQDQIDLTSSDMLKSLVKELQGKGLAVYMADVHAPVREFSRKTGLLDLIGEDHLFPTVELAVQHIEATAKTD